MLVSVSVPILYQTSPRLTAELGKPESGEDCHSEGSEMGFAKAAMTLQEDMSTFCSVQKGKLA